MTEQLITPKVVTSKDPLSERELFVKFSRSLDGLATEQVTTIGLNLIVNALRQECPTRQAAEARMSELFGRTMQILLDHYESTGVRKNTFPHTQIIRVESLVKDYSGRN